MPAWCGGTGLSLHECQVYLCRENLIGRIFGKAAKPASSNCRIKRSLPRLGLAGIKGRIMETYAKPCCLGLSGSCLR